MSNRRYKPKHSFDQLISDGTGPSSLIADENFWQSVHSDATAIALELEDHNEREVLSGMESLQCKVDHGIPFLVEDVDSVISQIMAQDSLIKITEILLESEHGNIILSPTLIHINSQSL